MTRWRALSVSLAGVLASLAMGGVAHYAHYTHTLCHPERRPITEADRSRARELFPNLEEVSFAGASGVTLRGWFVPPRNGVVVTMVHGLWGNRAFYLPEAELVSRHGYGVLLYDSRAHGESDGDTATWGDREAGDATAAIAFASGHTGVGHVAILGFSVGASAVARAAANDPRAEAVILYATWTSLREECAYKWGKLGWLSTQAAVWGFQGSGVNLDNIRPIDDIPRIAPRPLLLLAGMEDTDTPPGSPIDSSRSPRSPRRSGTSRVPTTEAT